MVENLYHTLKSVDLKVRDSSNCSELSQKKYNSSLGLFYIHGLRLSNIFSLDDDYFSIEPS